MAEDAGNVGTVIPGEDPSGSSQNVQNIDAAREVVSQRARDQGWTDEQEWVDAGKDLADWVSAREFVGRKSLFDKIHSQKNEIFQLRNEHKKELAEIKKYIANMTDVEYKRALSDLQRQRREAFQEGQLEVADQLQEQIDNTKEAQREVKEGLRETKPSTQSDQVHPAVAAWILENKWFDTDLELRAEAEEIGAGIAVKNQALAQNDPAALLEKVTEKIKKLHPEKFKSVVKKEPSVSKVEGGTTKSTPNSNGKKIELAWSDLTEEQQRIGRTVISSRVLDDKAKKNSISPRDQYLLDMQDNLRRSS